MDHTDDIDAYYFNQSLDEMQDLIEDAESTTKQLSDQLAKIKDEFDHIYDKAYGHAEALDLIEDALAGLDK